MVLKVQYCRYENLPISLPSHKINMPKVSRYNIVHFSRYTHTRYMTCLLTNIQKQKNMLKSTLLFKKNTNFTGTRQFFGLRMRNFQVLFSYGADHIMKFSNPH